MCVLVALIFLYVKSRVPYTTKNFKCGTAPSLTNPLKCQVHFGWTSGLKGVCRTPRTACRHQDGKLKNKQLGVHGSDTSWSKAKYWADKHCGGCGEGEASVSLPVQGMATLVHTARSCVCTFRTDVIKHRNSTVQTCKHHDQTFWNPKFIQLIVCQTSLLLVWFLASAAK